MSRHKYRAWDSDCEVMYYSDKEYDDCEFGFDKGVVVAWLRETEPQTLDEPAYDYGKAIETEQFTGLKDKNGVEIWEGDIYELSRPGYAPHKIRRLIGIKDGETYPFGKSMACGHHYQGKWTFRPEHGNVIGNIHQHPKLLKEKE